MARLAHAETGDTLSDPADPAVLSPWTMPEPLLPVAISARTSSEEDKLMQGLARLQAEDPTVRVEVNPATEQLVMWTMGEQQLDVLLDRLRTRSGIEVAVEPVRVAMRETVRKPRRGAGPARQAVRRARAVRGRADRGRAAPAGRRVRVRRPGRRRRGAPAVHPERGEGRPRPDGQGRRRAIRWSTCG